MARKKGSRGKKGKVGGALRGAGELLARAADAAASAAHVAFDAARTAGATAAGKMGEALRDSYAGIKGVLARRRKKPSRKPRPKGRRR